MYMFNKKLKHATKKHCAFGSKYTSKGFRLHLLTKQCLFKLYHKRHIENLTIAANAIKFHVDVKNPLQIQVRVIFFRFN